MAARTERRQAEVVGQERGVSDLYVPGPWCPARSEVSGWHCRSSAAGAAERRLWADRPPLCRRSLTETRQTGKTGDERKEGKKAQRTQTDWRTCACVCTCLLSVSNTLNRGWPTAFVGRESSFRFSSHSWSCFFTLFISDSCEVRRRQNVVYIGSCVMSIYGGNTKSCCCSTHRVVECIDPGRPWRQAGTVKLPLRSTTEAQLNN